MNRLEIRMVELLKELKSQFSVIGIKAEFEAEGTRLEEALRLKEVVTRAGLELTIKVGGCEAIRDMYDARLVGVKKIVAPMIESAFALKKFCNAIKTAFTQEDYEESDLFINIETITAYRNLDEILNSSEIHEVDGVVLGRGDLVESLGLTRHEVNKPEVLEISNDILVKSKAKGLTNGMGGGVTVETIPFLQKLTPGCLDYFETRKVIFEFPHEFNSQVKDGIFKALDFELMWLKNKRDYYHRISVEDDKRIITLEERQKKSK